MLRTRTISRFVFLVISPLVAGTFFYIFSGHTHLSFYPIAKNNSLFHWLLQHLPDGLWTFSLTSLMILIWKNELTKWSLPFICCGILSGMLFEFLQKWGMMKGTFDVIDILVSILAGILALIFSRPSVNFNFKNLNAIS